ncbi:PP2C family protein-serine/threonine phosphatase [Methylobacterium segetis]|uniref:PP2C family protein-serine/threonine phosphatase n=1 Tax=Methylobacterium segetis TaxID=2488750 RepID=UPI001FE0B985|nr:protein phosphatase 2C domain-containing protein [Methylobacterium segetis]
MMQDANDPLGLPLPGAPGLPGPSPFRCAALSDTGRVRQLNEDRYLLAPEIGVFAVADGMGGHEAGEVASTTVVESLASIGAAVSPNDLLARLEDRILRANMAIQEIGQARDRVIGTTVAVLLAFERNFACVWSGDSRIYRLRGGDLLQLSRDHTEVQQLIDAGTLTSEEARTWPRRNVITRAVGVRPEPEIELSSGVLEPGDTFLICSDGLTGHAEPEDIRARLDGAEPQAACDALVALALERGGTDNVTVVVVRYDPAPGPDGPGAPDEVSA